jgi:hypothetical protein
VSLPTVGLWRRNFSERGLDGLADAPRSGLRDRSTMTRFRSGLLKASGTVTGKLARWLASRGYIDESSAGGAAERAQAASRDLPVADRLGGLLHDVAAGAPEIDVDALDDADWVEDQLAISDVQPGRIWFEDGVDPIEVPRQASDLARPGWTVFVTAARTAGSWHLIEVGFVYP